MKLKSKITLVLLVLSLGPLAISSALISHYERKGDRKDILNHLESVAAIQQARIYSSYKQNMERLRLVSSRTQLRISLNEFIQSHGIRYQIKMNRILSDAIRSIQDFNKIMIFSVDGTIVASTDSKDIGSFQPKNEAFQAGLEQIQGNIFSRDNSSRLIIHLSAPLFLDDKILGVMVIDSATDNILHSISDYSGLGESGETILATKNSAGDAVFIMPLRFNKNALLNLVISKDRKDIPIAYAIKGEAKIFTELIDYRNTPVFAVTRYIKEANWGLVVKIDKSEVFSHLNKKRVTLVIILTGTSIIIILASLGLARKITFPIVKLINTAKDITDGDLLVKADESASDEIGLLGCTFNAMTESLFNLKKDLENRINEQHAITLLLENVLDSTQDLIFAKDIKLQIIMANKAYANAVRKSPKEMIGFTDIENGWDPALVYGNSDKGIRGFEQDDKAALEGHYVHNSYAIANVDDAPRFFETQKFPLFDAEEKIIGVLGVARDITERLQAEEKVKSQEEQLRRTQKMDALGKLTGGIAHDYNNMLGVIMGYSELLEGALSEQPRLAKYANEIYRAGKRGAKLTKKLLSFSRKKSTDAQMLNLNALLRDEQHMLEKILTARIQLDLDLADDLWPVWLDSGDLEDAIVNLSINAMHAIEGNGKLTLRTRNEQLNAMDARIVDLEPGDYVLLGITDTGCGMDEATKERIFEPFYSTKGEKGTGLGLSQVYGFVERSNGAIKVYSETGHGTRFTLYFPRHTESGRDEQSATQLVADIKGTEAILVVDDEPALLELIREILDRYGYDVICAQSGQQALDILATESIDLLLSDVIMPEMDGYQLAKTVHEKYPAVKIQLVSGFGDNHYRGLVGDDLYQNLLNKPVSSKILLQRMRALLDS